MTSHYRVLQAARLLHLGGLIAYPTEGVWGLGCDPGNPVALARLLELKSRDPAKGLILVAAEQSQFQPLLEGLDKRQLAQLSDSWPGHVTWLVPHRNRVHPLVHGRSDRVALRVSSHPLVAALCRAFGGPVISTSANPQGKDPALDGWQARGYFGPQLDYVLDGPLGGAAGASEIRDLSSGDVLRPGSA